MSSYHLTSWKFQTDSLPKIGVGEFRLFPSAKVQGRGGGYEVAAEGRRDIAVGVVIAETPRRKGSTAVETQRPERGDEQAF